MTRVIIDPVDDFLYMSFYVYGLEVFFGSNNVHYSSEPFASLSTKSRHSKSTRFIIEEYGQERRFVIHCNDSFPIIEELYDWCDVYGSVNANFAKTAKVFHKKLVALCPSFGIRCWNLPQTLMHAVANRPQDGTSVRKYLGKHKRMLCRPTYPEYLTHVIENNNYVFFISTLWYNDEWNKNDEGVNMRRATFIRTCKELKNVQFEGGLVSQGKDRSSEDLFADCLSKEVSMKEWMRKTKRSALVFNTPAFWDCHGWKLGEYLAMGKCILSTELSNDLPVPLEHGKNIHLVDNNQESMRDATRFIITHPDYRKTLENGTRAYWERYGSPVASLKLLGIKK